MLTGYKDKNFALIGKVPDHKYQSRLHGMLADYRYVYEETGAGALKRTLQDLTYDGFSIGFPHQVAAMQYVDELSDVASLAGCVSAAIRRDGKLYGENTDCLAFLTLLENNRIDPTGKKAVVLGSGATSMAVYAALLRAGADEVVVISREGESNYSSLELHDDAAILVNTTPVGMAPDFASSPVSLRYFSGLEAVIDVIYNPFRTELMLAAEEQGIAAIGGFEMLTEKAKLTCELFTGRHVSSLASSRVSAALEAEIKNIILVGLPGCGMSAVAAELSRSLARELVDTDKEVSRQTGLDIPEIFELFGEEYFRQREADLIKEVTRGDGIVIACGAGAILREENIKELRRKSTVVFLRREIERLAADGRRAKDSLMKLYHERIPLYLAASDVIVEVGPTPKDTAKAIVKAIYHK